MDQTQGPLELQPGVTGDIQVVGIEVKKDEATAEKPIEYTVEEFMERIDAMGLAMRALIVDAKRMPVQKSMQPYEDPVRSLAQAQAYLQIGFMWLRKGIRQPKEF